MNTRADEDIDPFSQLLSLVGSCWLGASVWAQGSDDDCCDVMVVMATAINK